MEYLITEEQLQSFLLELQEDVGRPEYLPKELRNAMPATLVAYAGGKRNVLYHRFIKDTNRFFPQSANGTRPFDTYVSLFGGALGDVTTIKTLFPDMNLILNKYNQEMFDLKRTSNFNKCRFSTWYRNFYRE